jgi:hypothetical protein
VDEHAKIVRDLSGIEGRQGASVSLGHATQGCRLAGSAGRGKLPRGTGDRDRQPVAFAFDGLLHIHDPTIPHEYYPVKSEIPKIFSAIFPLTHTIRVV